VCFALDGMPEEFNMSLAYPKDMDGNAGKISILTPVGTALLGLKVGDSIRWERQNGAPFELRVRGIAYQPERAGELHR
jgi:regulator of nucleoside diphosphate kinase